MRPRTWMMCGLLLLLINPVKAHGEGFADLFAGASLTSKGDVDTNVQGLNFTGEQEYKTSFTVGGRTGWWFGLFGVNLDLAYFRPQPDPDKVAVSGVDPVLGPFTIEVETDLDVVAIGLNAMLRGQFIKSPDVPEGRLQPYIFAGPTLFISTLDFDASISGPLVSAQDSESDTTTTLGVTAGGGISFLFTKNIGVFGEYRFTHVKPEFKFSGTKIEPRLDTHHILAGLTFRF
jgi:opacity protein-like surface antigen